MNDESSTSSSDSEDSVYYANEDQQSGSDMSNNDYSSAEGAEDSPIQLVEFDRDLPSAHTYLPNSLVTIPGRSILEPGWVGCLLCWYHRSVIFPGETLPMVFGDTGDMDVLQNMIQTERMFGLIFHYENSRLYGVLCEVVEATPPSFEGLQRLFRQPLSFKAKARQRFRLLDIEQRPLSPSNSIDQRSVQILPDVMLSDPLQNSRLFNTGRHKNAPATRLNELLRRADSALTPWPQFIYDLVDTENIIEQIRAHFKTMLFDKLPSDPMALSFWIGTNLALSDEERLDLFIMDNAVLRLYTGLCHIKKIRNLNCIKCMTEICSKSAMFAMSSEGLYSNFCNLGGYVHDILSVRAASNVALHGLPSTKFTWFPGYRWTIAVCRMCGGHVGWKFEACRKNLVPQMFWGLCRNSLVPIAVSEPTPEV